MSEPKTADEVVRDIFAKIDAATSDLSEKQRAESEAIARAQVENMLPEIEERLSRSRKWTPEGSGEAGNGPDAFTRGTKWERLGLDDVDLQIAHGIVSDAVRTGMSKRGPSEELTNIVTAMQNRAEADEGASARAMDTSDTTAVIGAQYVTNIWEASMAQSVVMPLINSFPMSAKIGYIPVLGAPPVPIAYPESVTDDSADYDTQDTTFARVTATAKKFGSHQKWSGEIEEESIVPWVATIRARMQASIAYYGDDIIVNGDDTIAATGNVNSDDAQLASTDRRVQFDGIRHAALVDNTANVTNAGGTLTYAHLIGLRQLCIDRTRLVNWGRPANAADFVYLVNPEGEAALENLDELVTLDKYGSDATVLTGEIRRIGRNPIISAMAVPLTEADGKVSTTPGNNTLSQIVAFNRTAYSIGYLRQITTETYRVPQRDQSGIVMFWRMALARYTPTGAASGIEHTAVIRNFS